MSKLSYYNGKNVSNIKSPEDLLCGLQFLCTEIINKRGELGLIFNIRQTGSSN